MNKRSNGVTLGHGLFSRIAALLKTCIDYGTLIASSASMLSRLMFTRGRFGEALSVRPSEIFRLIMSIPSLAIRRYGSRERDIGELPAR